MSQVQDILSSITTAAQALEEKPRLESRIAELERSLNSSQEHNQGLEQNIANYKSQIDQLNDKVRSLEVERDQAQFRILELEDANHRAVQTMREGHDKLLIALGLIDPPKPEPEPQVVEQAPQAEPSLEEAIAYGFPSDAGPTSPVDPTPTKSFEPAPGPYKGKTYMSVPGYVSRWDWYEGGGTDYGYDYRGLIEDADTSKL